MTNPSHVLVVFPVKPHVFIQIYEAKQDLLQVYYFKRKNYRLNRFGESDLQDPGRANLLKETIKGLKAQINDQKAKIEYLQREYQTIISTMEVILNFQEYFKSDVLV